MAAKFSNPRPSPIVGQWYPGEENILAKTVDAYLEEAEIPQLPGDVLAVVAPHAGHRFSGPVAGYAFASIQGLRPSVVAVISPMHHPYKHGLLTTAHDAYETPLGAIPVDRAAVQQVNKILSVTLGYGLQEVYADPEHSLEIELPFLQRALGGPFRLLPIMMRDQSAQVARCLGEALADVLGQEQALLVASTDLSHFYTQSHAQTLDQEMLRRIEALDPAGVLQAEIEGIGFACGRGAVAAVLWAAQELGANNATLLHYATSGDVSGDFSAVVGYGAVAVTKSGAA
jgi:AmmeMemoRadiSam system protein B